MYPIPQVYCKYLSMNGGSLWETVGCQLHSPPGCSDSAIPGLRAWAFEDPGDWKSQTGISHQTVCYRSLL